MNIDEQVELLMLGTEYGDEELKKAMTHELHQRLMDAVAASPPPVRRIIVAAEPVTSIDVTSADMLTELVQALSALLPSET